MKGVHQMYNFIIDSVSNIPDNIMIETVEQKYNITFPYKLKEYYSLYNGVPIKLCTFIINDTEYEVNRILPLISTSLSVDSIAQNDRIDNFISNEWFPFAQDRGGDIYYWNTNNETIALIRCDNIENPIKICNNITDFFHIMNNNIR